MTTGAPVIAPTAWARWPHVATITDALGGGTARIVGGAVRDTLAQLPVSDIDIATSLTPADVIARLTAVGFSVVPTGIAHGTVTAVTRGGPIEITTLRRDVATDGRHARIAFTQEWRDDAARRDFTINALYADIASGTVFDYFGGVDDLAAKRVRFIGDPRERIAEDHLRILRFFRFSARFAGGGVDAAGLAACAARANDLMALSRERIADELLKLLGVADPAPTVALMIASGIFAPVLPEITSAAPLAALHGGDSVRRLASLIPPDPLVAERIAARLKLSKLITKRLITAAARTPADAHDPRGLAYRLGKLSAQDRLALLGDHDGLAAIADWPVPTFGLTGGALVKRGIVAGPEVARALKAVEQQWISEGFPGPVRIAAIADEIAAQHRVR